MKELSIEQKAKRYDEAIEKAKDMLSYKEVHREDMEYLFPELAEPEDERIRKSLIEWLEDFPDTIWKGHYKKDIIAWLEKQSTLAKVSEDEQKPAEEYNITGIGSKHAEGKLGEMIKNLKPVNVEPKFKVGDWVVNNQTSNIYLVKEVKDDKYFLSPLDGIIEGYLRIIDVDTEYHLWTIADAKCGDVLYSPCCKLLWIYKDDNSCYIGKNLNYNENSVVVDSSICVPADVVPATKEQRDLLFQEVKEADYKWQLQKIENESAEEFNGEDYGIDSLWHAQRILENTLGKVEGYQSDDGILEHKCAISAVKKLYKQKPWSEEFADIAKHFFELGIKVHKE